MAKVKPHNAWPIWDSDPLLGIVRCPDGDLDTWRRLAADVLEWDLAGVDRRLAPPVWGWWRWMPDWTREYRKVLREEDGPGRGVWRGAPVVLKEVRDA